MSDTSKTAEPTENQGGGSTTTATITPEGTVVEEATPAAEPTENQGGGSD